MNVLRKQIAIAVVLLAGFLFTGIASASTILMNFDQLNANGEYVDNYYNGGCGGSYAGTVPTCGGTNDGVVWSNLLVGGAPNGIYPGSDNEPSAPIVGFTGYGSLGDGLTATMNVAAGFTTLSFYYDLISNQSATVGVYSGLDGGGTQLANIDVPNTGQNCGATIFSCWVLLDVPFSGTARSVLFIGDDYLGLDNVSLGSGSAVSVPEPAAVGLFGLGLLLIGGFVSLRRRIA